MGFIDKIFRFGNSRDLEMSEEDAIKFARHITSTKERSFIETRLGVPLHKLGDYEAFMETGFKKVWATYRACKLISASIISANFKLTLDDGLTEVTKPEDTRLLTSPNPYDSWEDLMEMWVFHMELTGNAYWLKNEIDGHGRPTDIYPLLPQHIEIIPDKENKIKHYNYKVNGHVIQIPVEEMIHFKNPHPNSLIFGLGSIEPSQDLYSSFINRNTLEDKFLENGAQPSGILTRDSSDGMSIDPEEFKKLKREWQKSYGGKKNAGKTAFLDGKWNYQKLGLTMLEMQSIEREKWSVEQIFINHGVPMSVAGIEGAANYATSRQDEINFRKYKVVPLLNALTGKINHDGFFSAKDNRIRFTYELSGLIDVEQITKEYMPLVEIGAMTRNELREKCGMGIVDNPLLDEFTVDSDMIPLDLIHYNTAIDTDDSDIAKSARSRRKKRSIQRLLEDE